MYDFDLIVIGGGSGGVRAARLAAATGAKVALIEKQQLGGTCVNLGCVPKKLFYYAAGFNKQWQLATAYGYPKANLGDFCWHTLKQHKDVEIARLNQVYTQLLKTAKVKIIEGHGQLLDNHLVIVNDQKFSGERILLAVGSRPSRLSITGEDLAVVSDDLFHLSALPKSAVLIGGGYIALEFASIFNGLGVQTTLTYRAKLPLRHMDEPIKKHLAEGISAGGICQRPNVSPISIKFAPNPNDNGNVKRLLLSDGSTVDADLIVFATGRKPATENLGLSNVDIATNENGTIKVRPNYQSTTCPSVYAIGDLLSTPALTPVAIAEAKAFVQQTFVGDKNADVDYNAIPTAIFSRPSVATTGISENMATQQQRAIKVYQSEFRPMKTGFANNPQTTLIRLIVDAKNDKVIGAQIVGDDAAEIMQGLAIAIKAGVSKQQVDQTVGIHPSTAEEFVTLTNYD